VEDLKGRARGSPRERPEVIYAITCGHAGPLSKRIIVRAFKNFFTEIYKLLNIRDMQF